MRASPAICTERPRRSDSKEPSDGQREPTSSMTFSTTHCLNRGGASIAMFSLERGEEHAHKGRKGYRRNVIVSGSRVPVRFCCSAGGGAGEIGSIVGVRVLRAVPPCGLVDLAAACKKFGPAVFRTPADLAVVSDEFGPAVFRAARVHCLDRGLLYPPC